MYKRLLLLASFFCNLLTAQKPLYIVTEKMYDSTLINSDSANVFIKNRAQAVINEINLTDKFSAIAVDKESDLPPGARYIKMYSSYAYLTSKGKKNIIPKYIVHKRNWQTPFYYSYFIGRRGSIFNSLDDFPSVKAIYLREGSMSGYYSALYKFWELGFIRNPSVKSLQDELHKKVQVFKTADSVIAAVSQDPNSIGATGEESFGGRDVEIKLVNMVLPQDVICMSENLTQYEVQMDTMISRIFSDTSLKKNAHLVITNLKHFTELYINSYKFSETILKDVDATKADYHKDIYLKRVIPLNDKITFSDIADFIGKSSFTVYLWILGILLAVYTLGHNTGNIFLPSISKTRNKIKNWFTFKDTPGKQP